MSLFFLLLCLWFSSMRPDPLPEGIHYGFIIYVTKTFRDPNMLSDTKNMIGPFVSNLSCLKNNVAFDFKFIFILSHDTLIRYFSILEILLSSSQL